VVENNRLFEGNIVGKYYQPGKETLSGQSHDMDDEGRRNADSEGALKW
jgi:hypothetical protein